MTQKIVETLVMGGIAIVMFWFAYAIGVKHKLELIAGYNERTAASVHDKPGLARLIARLCLLVGIAAALMPVATAIWGTRVAGFWACMGAFGGFLGGVVALTMLQARDYVTRPGAGHRP